jgi:hypothetical protein
MNFLNNLNVIIGVNSTGYRTFLCVNRLNQFFGSRNICRENNFEVEIKYIDEVFILFKIGAELDG